MSDIKKWGSDESQKFTDTSMGKITYSGPALAVDDCEINFDGVISTVAMFKAAPDLYKALEDLVRGAEMDKEQIDSEWGSGRTIEEIEADGDLSKRIINARTVLAKARGE